MKIAFVSANRERLPDEVVPLGLLYVMANTPEVHDKVLWDLCFEADAAAALAEHLRRFEPDLVALGLRNIQNSDYSGTIDNLDAYARLLSVVRNTRPQTKIILGGSGFSVMPAALMQKLKPDFGISGEGEIAFAHFLEALQGQRDITAVGNLHHFVNGTLVSNPPAGEFIDLDTLARPDKGLADPRYYAHSGIDSIQTKRGCPLRCDYCTYPIIEGRQIRRRHPEAIVDEILAAKASQPALKHFFIVDSVFNLPPKHAKEVCRAMIRRGLTIPWTCYANPIGFDQELAELMAEAGCAGMEIGSDSGCDDVLTRLKKGFDTSQIRTIHSLSAAAGVKDCHTFILGTQGETLEHVHRTLDFIVDLDPFAAILMAWTDDYEALDPALRSQRQAFRTQIIDLLREKKSQFPRWIIPPLAVNFDAKLFAFLRRKGLQGPLWQHITMVPA